MSFFFHSNFVTLSSTTIPLHQAFFWTPIHCDSSTLFALHRFASVDRSPRNVFHSLLNPLSTCNLSAFIYPLLNLKKSCDVTLLLLISIIKTCRGAKIPQNKQCEQTLDAIKFGFRYTYLNVWFGLRVFIHANRFHGLMKVVQPGI